MGDYVINHLRQEEAEQVVEQLLTQINPCHPYLFSCLLGLYRKQVVSLFSRHTSSHKHYRLTVFQLLMIFTSQQSQKLSA